MQRQSNYKSGSYGVADKKKNAASKHYAYQSNNNQAIIQARRGGAPLANRGFRPTAVAGNKERKYFDTPGQAYACNTAGNFILLNIPVTGTDYNDRIGRKISSRSIYVRGEVTLTPTFLLETNPATTYISNGQQVRMILFVDSQPNGAAPAVLDLLTEAFPRGQLNPNNRDRFRILKDKIFVFDPFVYFPVNDDPMANGRGAVAAFNRTTYHIKMYKKLNIETIFNQGVGGTIGDINTNAIYLFFIGNHAPSATLQATAEIAMRLRFDDI